MGPPSTQVNGVNDLYQRQFRAGTLSSGWTSPHILILVALSERGRGMKRLFTTAKVRKLDRVAVGYLVAAWVVVQAGSIAFPAFDAPPWAMKLLIAASVVGLPLTLLVAWFWRI